MSTALVTRTSAVLDIIAATSCQSSHHYPRHDALQRTIRPSSLGLRQPSITRQNYATDASKKKAKKRYIVPTAVSTPPRRDPYMFPKAREWATAVGIGTPVSLRPFKLVLPPHLRGVGFAPKYSPLPTIRSTDMPVYFAALEHPMSAYQMLKYERKLATHSLFLYVHVGVTARPIVRNYVERWVRDAIWAAMREKGYSNTGRVLPVEEIQPGVTPPSQDMCGTLLVKITNPSKLVTLKRSQSLEIGRHVVQTVLRDLAPRAYPNPLLQPVQFPADFLPHYKKKALLAQIEKGWEEESKGIPRVKTVEEKLAEAIATKENFYPTPKSSGSQAVSGATSILKGLGKAVATPPQGENISNTQKKHLAEEAELVSDIKKRWINRLGSSDISASKSVTADSKSAPVPKQPPVWDADEIERRWNEAGTPKTVRKGWKPRDIF